jgi:hypothetical protein
MQPLEQVGKAEVARLLKDPGSGRVRRATGKVDTPAAELDEEQHLEAAQRDRLDGEEVAGEEGRSPRKRWPADRVTARGGLEPGRGKQPPDGARRDAEAELEQLARDPLVAPSRFSRASRSTSSRSARSVGGRPGPRRG